MREGIYTVQRIKLSNKECFNIVEYYKNMLDTVEISLHFVDLSEKETM